MRPGHLAEQVVVVIGSVDFDVAERARLLLRRVLGVHDRESRPRRVTEGGRRVALQAQEIHVAVLQHVRIGAPMRNVAGGTTLDFDGGVRENERPLLIGVAFEAAIVAGVAGADLTDEMIGLPVSRRSVLVMAISAFNQSLVHTMTKRHIELGALLQVASVTKLRLVLNEKLFAGGGVMRRMAIDAAYVVQPVKRIRAVNVSRSVSVAGKAALIDHLLRGVFGHEVENEFLGLGIFRVRSIGFQFGFGMGFARTMAAVAAGSQAGLQSRLRLLIVRARMYGLGNALRRGRMATSARRCSRVTSRLGLRLRGCRVRTSRSGLLLREYERSHSAQPKHTDYEEPDCVRLPIISHPRPFHFSNGYVRHGIAIGEILSG